MAYPELIRLLQPPSGWTVAQHDDFVSMTAPTGDAELRLTTFDPEAARIDAVRWIASVAYSNRKIGRTLTAAEYGSFSGYALEVVALGNRIRAWFLRAGSLPLIITHRSPESVGHRDDGAVSAALHSLTPAATVSGAQT